MLEVGAEVEVGVEVEVRPVLEAVAVGGEEL